MPFDNDYRNRVIFDDSDSSDESSAGEPPRAATTTATPLVVAKEHSAVRAPATANNKTSAFKPPQRKFSFDSILSDSSEESIGALFRKASISKKLLSKPPTAIDFNGGIDSSSSDDSDSEEERLDDSVKVSANEDDEAGDVKSAWCQNEGSKDFVLSAEKVPGVHWPELCLPFKLYHQLFSFQQQGVQWMASLHTKGIGGILGDGTCSTRVTTLSDFSR